MNTQEKIEKIREKVILANNPNAVDLSHALDLEFCHNNCSIEVVRHFDLDEDNVINDEQHEAFCTKELWRNHYDCSIEQYQQKEYCGEPFYSVKKIIGKPLTLERVLVSIEYKHDRIWSFQYQANIGFYINSFSQGKIIWQPNKTLENQSEQTIDAIYKILCI
jgi:hypothetical protein